MIEYYKIFIELEIDRNTTFVNMEDPAQINIGQGQQPAHGRGKGVTICGNVARGRQQNRGRCRRVQRHRHVSDEIQATLVDHVIHYGLTMAEAGDWVQPK